MQVINWVFYLLLHCLGFFCIFVTSGAFLTTCVRSLSLGPAAPVNHPKKSPGTEESSFLPLSLSRCGKGMW